CPDTSIPDQEINLKIRAFGTQIKTLRKQYSQDSIQESLLQALSGKGQGDVYSRFPPGQVFKQGKSVPLRTRITEEELEDLIDSFKTAEKKPRRRRKRPE